MASEMLIIDYLTIIMISLIMVSSSSLVPNLHLELNYSTNRDVNREGFDYFIFSQQWPGTYCLRRGSCCSKISNETGFTIHGLWPEYNNGRYPLCCNGPAYDESKIVTLLDTLQKYWPSLSCGKSSKCHGKMKTSFWGHERTCSFHLVKSLSKLQPADIVLILSISSEKHGTCSYPVIENEYDYFSMGLKIYEQYNLLKALEQNGIYPLSDTEYQTSDIIKSIANTFGAKPELVCSSGKLQELRLCFTKDFKIEDCDKFSSSILQSNSNSCSSSITLPAFDSPKSMYM